MLAMESETSCLQGMHSSLFVLSDPKSGFHFMMIIIIFFMMIIIILIIILWATA